MEGRRRLMQRPRKALVMYIYRDLRQHAVMSSFKFTIVMYRNKPQQWALRHRRRVYELAYVFTMSTKSWEARTRVRTAQRLF